MANGIKSVGIAFIWNNHILLEHHPKSKNFKRSLSIPKGGQNDNEIGADFLTAYRELKEELNIDVPLQWIIDAPKHSVFNSEGREIVYFIIKIDKLSELNITEKVLNPINYQREEVDWAGFMTFEEAWENILPYQRDILKKVGYNKFSEGGLVAPNGKPSNLTPEQHKLVRTPEFKAWFGDWENDPQNASKVVDENGEPKVVYHATKGYVRKFNEFKPTQSYRYFYGKKIKVLSPSFFFADDKNKVKSFGRTIIPVFLKIIDPLDYKYSQSDVDTHLDYIIGNLQARYPNNDLLKGDDTPRWVYYDYNEYVDRIQSLGFDGVFDEERDRFIVRNTFIVFNSRQIKLADGSNTTFDGSNPDIRFDDGGSIKTTYKYSKEGEQKEYSFKEINSAVNSISEIENNDVFTSIKEFVALLTDSDGGNGSSKYHSSRLSRNNKSVKIRVSNHTGNYDDESQYVISIVIEDMISEDVKISIEDNYTEIRVPNKKRKIEEYIDVIAETINNSDFDGGNPDIRFDDGGAVRPFTDDGNKLVVFSEYRNYTPYKIAVNDINDADYITLWKTDIDTGKDKKVGALKLNETMSDNFLKVSEIGIDTGSKGLGLGLEMYKVALKYSSDRIKGIKSYLPDRSNKKQVPKIYKKLNSVVEGDWDVIYKDRNSHIGFSEGGGVGHKKEIYKKWKSLVNMSKSELEKFYNSQEGKEAGMSTSDARKQGISSGRESARWIIKMKDTNVSDWTPTMWRWAKKQISFISRMLGNKGDLLDENGNKTRKHTSLLIWGHNPNKKKFDDGGKVDSVHYKQGNIKLALSEHWYDDDSGVELVPVSELIKFKEFDRNVVPKYNKQESTEKINHLSDSYKTEGIREPLIIEYSDTDKSVLLIEGNHRLNSAIELGIDYLPARVVLRKSAFPYVQKEKSMNVTGVTSDRSGYIRADLKPSSVGIANTTPVFEQGGIIEGRLHSECGDDGCGRKFEVGGTGSVIEAERDEAVIVSKAFDDNDVKKIKGTPSEIASALNVLGGGKSFDKGAEVFDSNEKPINTPELKKQANNTDVEDDIEGGSIIINRRSMADEKEYEVTGTPRQIASAINSIDGNGVKIEDGATIKK